MACRTAAGTPVVPTSSALADASRRLRDAIRSQQAVDDVSALADAPPDTDAVIMRLRHELREGQDEVEVLMLGEPLPASGRRSVVARAPGPSEGGGPSLRSLKMALPTVEDINRLISKRKEETPRIESNQKLVDALEKYLNEKFLGKSSAHVALLAAWGPKAIADAEGEFAEVAALMALSLRASRAAMTSAKEDFQFEVQRLGDGKECLVMPPSNFALLGLKDAFHMLLQGFRVIIVVQPRFFSHFREIQDDLIACGLPANIVEVLPGITPEAEPAVLHELLRHVDRLQFTGSSAMFQNLVLKAYELGNLRMEHAGEVSGLNKVRLEGVSITHPAAAAGSAWAAMANNGELCTSASLIEFDPATGDSPAVLKSAMEAHSFKLGRDPLDPTLNVLLRDGKAEALQVHTEEPATGFREWWEKTVMVAPKGSNYVRTNQSLGHCIYSPSIEQSLALGVKEDASCIYCVGLPKDMKAPFPRAGTTGCKIPESVFGGMKTYTYAVAGDHDGVGSVQTLLDTVKRRGATWRDQEEASAEYELTETAEMLLDFLRPQDQKLFSKQVFNVLEVFTAFMPEVTKPYNGQGLAGGPGQSQLVTLPALRPARMQMLIPRGVGLPEDIVKAAVLMEMSPLKNQPVDLHLLEAKQSGLLRVTDPLKSFLRVVEKRLGWRIHYHDGPDALAANIRASEYPTYFYCVKDKHLLPIDVLTAVVQQCGYVYEELPRDALSLFRWMTTSQGWTVSCTEAQVAEAREKLLKAWQSEGLRHDPLPAPKIVQPKSRGKEVGGGFGATAGMEDDKDWGELSEGDDSDLEGVDPKTSAKAVTKPWTQGETKDEK